MSKGNGLVRHYDKLDAAERFRLDVLAMARGDDHESARLVSSCPRWTYTTNDRAFTGRWSGAENITLRMCAPVLEQLGKLRLVDSMRVMEPYLGALYENTAFDAYHKGHEAGSYHAWNYAGRAGHPPAWPKGEDPSKIWEPDEDERDPAMERDEEELQAVADTSQKFLAEILDKLERDATAAALTAWTGYAAFCERSAGVDPEKLVGVILGPALGQIREMKNRAQRLGVAPDAETVEEIREGLAGTWKVYEERGI